MSGKQTYSRDSYRTGQHALTREELNLVLQHTNSFDAYVAIKFAALCGLRREDLASVKWSDIDITNNYVSFYESKKGRSHAVVFDNDLAADLRRLRAENPTEYYVFKGGSNKKYGKGHVTGRTLYNWFQDALVGAGLKNRPFHALRATCIKLCAAAGWTEAQTAELVNDSVRVIQQHYATPSFGEMKDVINNKQRL